MTTTSSTVRYQLGTYSGHVVVLHEESDDDDAIIARAKSILSRRCAAWLRGGLGPSGPCYESWKIVSRENDD
jgi:hypothetical protein